MIDFNQLDDLAHRLGNALPPDMRDNHDELHQKFKAVLQSGFSKLDLVTREEFEVQRAVLLRTREKIELLERRLGEIERGATGATK